jgi:hypothetical protein
MRVALRITEEYGADGHTVMSANACSASVPVSSASTFMASSLLRDAALIPKENDQKLWTASPDGPMGEARTRCCRAPRPAR